MNNARLIQKLSICFLFISTVCSYTLTIQESTVENRISILDGWKVSFSDKGEYKAPEYNDREWAETTLPFVADSNKTAGSTIIWLRNKLTVSPDLKQEKIFLMLGKLEGSLEVYLNGVLVYISGRFPPQYYYFSAMPKQTLLPGEIIRYGGENVVCLRIFNETATFKALAADVGNFDAYLYDSKLLKFINMDVYLLFSFLSLVVGGYFLLQYLSRKSERTNLHFSLANFCFAVYFFSMGMEASFLPFHLVNAISQSCMPLFFPLLVIFFVNYFKIHNYRWLKRILMGLGILLSLMFYLNAGEKTVIQDFFTKALAPGALELVFMTYIAIRATIQKNRDAIAIMIGAIFGFLFGIHDMIYQFSGMQPFTWLQGLGIFIFNMSMFVSLSNRTMRAFKDLEVSSMEIVYQTGELETYISNIAELSGKVSGMSAQLDSSIASASGSIDKMAASSQAIITNIQAQFDTVQKTSSAVMGLLDALDVTYGDLGKQFSHVQETSATIEEMIANISAITKNVKHTTEFAEELRNSTSTGAEAVLESSKSIEGIRVVSENVNKIIDTVSDIAEQTNILSINAAIEASHAGAYGKGFAVVAGEIRRLSEGSSRNSKEISNLIKMIGERIQHGVRTNERVKDIFTSINGKTASAVDQIHEIYQAVLEQKTASEDIVRTLSLLQGSSEEMKKQADVQSSSGGIIRTNLDSLVSATGKVIEMINGISKEINAVLGSITHLKEISSDSLQVISRLKILMEKEDVNISNNSGCPTT